MVFDWDLIIPGLSMTAQTDVHTNASTWPGLKATWAAITSGVVACERDVVLLGPFSPDALASSHFGNAHVRHACLHWPDEIIADRLRARNVSDEEIGEELRSAKEFRSSASDQIDLADCDVQQMADRVAEWIHGRT